MKPGIRLITKLIFQVSGSSAKKAADNRLRHEPRAGQQEGDEGPHVQRDDDADDCDKVAEAHLDGHRHFDHPVKPQHLGLGKVFL